MLGSRVSVQNRLSTSRVVRLQQRTSVVKVSATAVKEMGVDAWNSTYYPKAADAANNVKPWFIINAEGKHHIDLCICVF